MLRKLFCFAVLIPRWRKRFPPHRSCGAKQAGKNSFPPTPFLFARLLETPSDFFGRRDIKLGDG